MRPRIEEFFDYARKRHECYLMKQKHGKDGWITDDPILYKHRFTNVFRELDRTTVWFRENVRDPLDESPHVMLATVLFRMFNRIEVGEAMFCQQFMSDSGEVRTAFEKFLIDGNVLHLRYAIKTYVGKNAPVATGAYIISSPPGFSKLDGILEIVKNFESGKSGGMSWREMAAVCTMGPVSLESVFDWLKEFPFFGRFHSYEIVTDLRHTHLLRRAPDVMRWCNVGPGAARGLARIHGRTMTTSGKNAERVTNEQMLAEMREILRQSLDGKHWPQHHKRTAQGQRNIADWPRWEMRDVEHTLCEFDKYERVRLGQGRPRGVYR